VEKILSTARAHPVDGTLVIVATGPATAIGLGDDAGQLVQNEVGALRSRLLPGDEVVACDVGRPTAPIQLALVRRAPPPNWPRGPRARGRYLSARRGRAARQWGARLREGLHDGGTNPPNQRVERTRWPAPLTLRVVLPH
jgi:hypothetical protein